MSKLEDLLLQQYHRLEDILAQGMAEGAVVRSTILQEWADGRILIDATTTASLYPETQRPNPRDLYELQLILRSLGEVRLRPAIGITTDSEPCIILYLSKD